MYEGLNKTYICAWAKRCQATECPHHKEHRWQGPGLKDSSHSVQLQTTPYLTCHRWRRLDGSIICPECVVAPEETVNA